MIPSSKLHGGFSVEGSFSEGKTLRRRLGIAIANAHCGTFGRKYVGRQSSKIRRCNGKRQPMKAQHGITDTANGSQSSNSRTFWISSGIFAACLALYIAELHGFRVFDESVRGTVAFGEPVIPSPLEIVTLLGAIAIGVSSGLISVVSSIIWLVRHLRHEIASIREGYESTPANCPVQQNVS
jgi:hypothetical protein